MYVNGTVSVDDTQREARDMRVVHLRGDVIIDGLAISCTRLGCRGRGCQRDERDAHRDLEQCGRPGPPEQWHQMARATTGRVNTATTALMAVSGDHVRAGRAERGSWSA